MQSSFSTLDNPSTRLIFSPKLNEALSIYLNFKDLGNMTENETNDTVAEKGTPIGINRHDTPADNDAAADKEIAIEVEDEPTADEKGVEDDPLLALEKELKTAREEATQSYDRFLRISAEFDNYKKRNLRETAEFKKYANETLLKNLLTVVDNLERAMEVSAKNGDSKGLIDGVELTVAEILKIFANFGVTPIEAVENPLILHCIRPCSRKRVPIFRTTPSRKSFKKVIVFMIVCYDLLWWSLPKMKKIT